MCAQITRGGDLSRKMLLEHLVCMHYALQVITVDI